MTTTSGRETIDPGTVKITAGTTMTSGVPGSSLASSRSSLLYSSSSKSSSLSTWTPSISPERSSLQDQSLQNIRSQSTGTTSSKPISTTVPVVYGLSLGGKIGIALYIPAICICFLGLLWWLYRRNQKLVAARKSDI